MSHSYFMLQPKDEPKRFVMYPSLEISGTVTNKQTGKLIPQFTVVRGNWSPSNSMVPTNMDDDEQPGGIRWSAYSGRSMKDGTYNFRIDLVRKKHYIKIEAPGFKPAVSRAFTNDEGKLSFDFELEESAGLAGTVVDQKGDPVKAARVVYVLPGKTTEVRNSAVELAYNTTTLSDADGKFVLPEQVQTFAIMVIADEGYAYVLEKEFIEAKQQIAIEPWATIRGQCMIGDGPGAGETMVLYVQRSEDEPENLVTNQWYSVAVEMNGSYEINRVPPNVTCRIGRRVIRDHKGGGQISSQTQGES